MAHSASAAPSANRAIDLTNESTPEYQVPDMAASISSDVPSDFDDIVPTDGDDGDDSASTTSSSSSEASDGATRSSSAIDLKEPKLSFSRLIKGLDRTYTGIKEAFKDDKPRLKSLTAAVRRTMKKAVSAQLDPTSEVRPSRIKHEIVEEIQSIHDRHSAIATISEVAQKSHDAHFGQHFGGYDAAYNVEEEIKKELALIKRKKRTVEKSARGVKKPSAPRKQRKAASPPASRPMTTRAASRREASVAAAAAAASQPALASAPSQSPPPVAPAPAVEEAAPTGTKRKREGGASQASKRPKTALPAEGVYPFADIPSVGTLFHMTTAEVFMAGVEYAVDNAAGTSTEVNERLRAFVREKLGETL
ncbi:hypothetical protein DM02DRAFT_626053 [Periconia macrospinosa]|uniref:Uncharacterized protein n=1 Tax=Periconia macrospinosa TaxID=97972 RepID=A0A2V1DXV4_9PLEO|nr:hypothetical protein DM02DRAFT_626053 [Periconia macrospinosa]